MTRPPIELYLKKLEQCRNRQDLSRRAMADELGIPPGTYANWYRKGRNKKNPSKGYSRWVKSFLLARGMISVETFLHKDGPDLLKRVGFKQAQAVIDFGCGNGDYSVILAKVVGLEGQVYAVDKSKDVLYELMGRAKGSRLDNITPTLVADKAETPTKIPLKDDSIDAAWFCDVLHDGYFEKDDCKEQLLRDVHRILRRKGFIAIHPVHMEEERLKKVIGRAGFYLEEEYVEELLFHGNEFHRGSVLKFRKARGVKEK